MFEGEVLFAFGRSQPPGVVQSGSGTGLGGSGITYCSGLPDKSESQAIGGEEMGEVKGPILGFE
jgi:hypothetical protein